MSTIAKFSLSFLVAVAVVLGYRYYDYKVLRDYLVHANVACDPLTERCFAEFDPEDETAEPIPYKSVVINARYAPQCLEEHACEAFACPREADVCEVRYCEAEGLEEGESCFVSPAPAEETSEEVDTIADTEEI